jgi:hypothetical protein
MALKLLQTHLQFRQLLKSNIFLFFVYSRIRCLLDNLKFYIIKIYFYFKREPKNLAIKKRILRKKVITLIRQSIEKKPHVYWLGNDYDQDFSGFMQSIEKNFLVSCYFDGDSYGQEWDHHYLDTQTKQIQSEKIKQSILSAHRKNKIDLLLMQTWGFKICKTILKEIKEETGCIVVNIGMDDKHSFIGKLYLLKNGTLGLINEIDYHLSASLEAVEWFRKSGLPCTYFPEASFAKIFFPIKNHQKKYQVGLIGGAYGIRTKIHEKLCESGISVTAYGFGWPQGRLDNDKVNEFYNSCEIVLGIAGIGHCLNFCSLKLRDFDVPLSGAFYLTSSCNDLLSEYVVGKEIETYNSINELVEKARYYLENNIERESIAQRGYRRALNSHTYKIRIENLIQKLVSGNL